MTSKGGWFHASKITLPKHSKTLSHSFCTLHVFRTAFRVPLNVPKCLLKYGAESLIHVPRNDQLTCLHISCHKGHVSIVKELLRCADNDLLLARMKHGHGCLHLACEQNHLDVVKLLLTSTGENTLSLLRMVARDGSTCLHVACHRGHVNIAKELLQLVDHDLLSARAKEGYSCLYLACHATSTL